MWHNIFHSCIDIMTVITASPLQVVAHSVGTWVAYELLRLAQSHGLPMPHKAFLSAMASPDIAFGSRPWRQQRSLAEEEFKVCLLSRVAFLCG